MTTREGGGPPVDPDDDTEVIENGDNGSPDDTDVIEIGDIGSPPEHPVREIGPRFDLERQQEWVRGVLAIS